MIYSLDDLFADKIGVGFYQIRLFCILIMVDLSEGAQLLLMSLVIPIAQKELGYPESYVPFLTSIFYLGIILGRCVYLA